LKKLAKAGGNTRLPILMYHSISEAAGPTSIPPGVFQQQMDILAECGYQTVSLAQVRAWHLGEADLPARSLAVTFDDGFADFADRAFPALKARGFTATVFLPSGRMGGPEKWVGADSPPRPLLTWNQARELSAQGIDFGGHSVTHADLTRLSAKELDREVGECRNDIARQLGRVPESFAPPYGRAGERERRVIRQWFAVSTGTRLGHANKNSDPYDLPRIEMHYFRHPGRWRSFLENRAELYLGTRQLLRKVRELATSGRGASARRDLDKDASVQ
jgi:peptidoglycan/xylan/chitin deacetylase (PgdA/CDA1 family)